MKISLIPLAFAAVVFFSPAHAQPKAAVAGETIEALVTVVSVDKKARSVVIRGPRGGTEELAVPPEAQNFDRIKAGDVFRVRYSEAVIVGLDKGEPAKGEVKDRKFAAKGENPGGVATRTRYISGRIDAIDTKTRHVALRGVKQTISFKVADDVNLDAVKVGERLTVAYAQALAIEMVPQPKAKPAAKKDQPAKKAQ
jgi:hypothetical protein